MTRKRRLTLGCLAAIGLVLAAYAAVVTPDLGGSMGDRAFVHEHVSWFVSTNLSFDPLPRLRFVNDQTLYPFGSNQVLQHFCLERDLVFTLLSRLFGRGPWLQVYFLGGLAVSAYGAFGLLRKDHGEVRATAVAILIGCFGFYGAQMYPHRFDLACVHWAALAIVCDFVIVDRLVARRAIGPSLLLSRGLLTALCAGLDRDHVLGFSLASLVATCLFGAVLLSVRSLRRRQGRDSEPSDLTRFGREARVELRGRPLLLLGLVAATALVGAVHGSLLSQVDAAARAHGLPRVELAAPASSPLHALVPYFPWIEGAPRTTGWLLLGLALLGIIQSRRRLAFAPFLVLFCVLLARAPGAVVASVVLALMALGVSFEAMPARRRRTALALCAAAVVLEGYTFGRIKVTEPSSRFDEPFMAHMAAIERLPGEAVLDFPFCILGASGDAPDLCPFRRLESVHALQRFHHKKVIGQRLARVHPREIQALADQRWHKLWVPDDLDPALADKQRSCPEGAEWEFLRSFYELNDFAGIQLAVDRLPAGCAEEFYARFGAPMGEVTMPTAGRLAFIPRAADTRARVDRERGKRVRLASELSSPVDAVRRRPAIELDESGLSGFESLRGDDGIEHVWRWALLPETRLAFDVDSPRELVVEARFQSPLPGQSIHVELDGRALATWEDVPQGTMVSRSATARVDAGRHSLDLRYAKGNAPPTMFAPADGRALAVMFESLVLRADLR